MEVLRELFQNPFAAWGSEASNTLMLFALASFLFGLWTAYLIWGRMASRRKKANRELEGQKNKLTADHLALSEKYDLRDADLQKSNLELEELNTRVVEADAQREKLHAQLFAFKDTNNKLKRDNETYLQKLDTLDNQIISLQTQNSQLNEEVEKNEANMENLNVLQSSYDATKNRLSAMEEKLATLAEVNNRLKNENVSYAKKVDALGSEISNLQKRNSQLNEQFGQNTSAMNELSGLKSSYDATQDRVAALEKKLADLENSNKSLRTELGSMQAQKFSSAPPVMPVVTKSQTTNNKITEEEEEEAVRIEKIIKTPTKSATEAKTALRNAMGTKIKKATAADKDDLKKINGIGPFIETKLNALDIYTYEQISQWDGELINVVTDAIEFFPGRIQRDDWVGQAKKLRGEKNTSTTTNANSSSSNIMKKVTLSSAASSSPSDMARNMSTNPQPQADAKALSKDVTDLKVIEGIGPAIERLLHNNGVKDWSALAEISVARLKAILTSAGAKFRLSDPGTWPQQAHLAAQGEWTKLKEYQDYLDGGKEPSKK